ncbi:MAG: hypothetical protein MJ048_05100, partial [Acidaminococcaceae bacterium]|nr:hypothetical protein [Acidaminococcaceae bacterium]
KIKVGTFLSVYFYFTSSESHFFSCVFLTSKRLLLVTTVVYFLYENLCIHLYLLANNDLSAIIFIFKMHFYAQKSKYLGGKNEKI